MSRLTLADADRIADVVLGEGRSRELAPLCVVVLDAGGHTLVVTRDERASIGRVEIARALRGGARRLSSRSGTARP